MTAPARQRQQAERLGRWAELLALWFLRLKGYRLLARRYKCRAGEIDLVMRKGNLLVFVEVKARRNQTDAAEAVTFRQRDRITRAAEHFLAAYQQGQNCQVRFDVLLVSPGKQLSGYWPRHIPDAWRPDI